MTVRWPYRDPIVSTRRAISDVLRVANYIAPPPLPPNLSRLPSNILEIALNSSYSASVRVYDKYGGEFLDLF